MTDMRSFLFAFLASCMLCTVPAQPAALQKDTVFVADYGIRPYTYENISGKLRTVLDDCKRSGAKVIVLENGRYDFWPDSACRRDYFISNTSSEEECPSKTKTLGILFDRMHDLVVEGNGATLMFHGKMTMLALDRCRNIVLRNLHFDFERPGVSELTYTKVDENGVEVALHRDSRYDIVDGRIRLIGEGWRQTENISCTEHDAATDRFYFSRGYEILASAPAAEVSRGVVRFDTPPDFRPQVGNTLTVRDIIRGQVGMLVFESEQITLEKVQIKFMRTLGIVSQYSRNITMRDVVCMPCEESGRLLASEADFMHFSGCSGKIRILGCRYSGAQDDPINVHGTNLRAVARPGDSTLQLRFMHPQSYGFEAFFAGDTVAFVRAAAMRRFAFARVTAVRRLSDRLVEVDFDRPVPAGLALNRDCVENISCTPELEVRNCYFTHTHTRGTLVTTPRTVVIADNTYCKTGMSAILIEGDAEGWYESGPVKDVLITHNTFIDCAYNGGPEHAFIALHPSNTEVDADRPVHENIRIIGNRFLISGNPVLYAKSTAGLVFRDNAIEPLPGTGIPSEGLFLLDGCKEVRIENNACPQKITPAVIRMEHMKKGSVRCR